MATQSPQPANSSFRNIEESLTLLCQTSDLDLSNPSEKTWHAAQVLERESLIRPRRPSAQWNAIARRFLSSVSAPPANADGVVVVAVVGGVLSLFARLHRARPAGADVESLTSWSGFEVYTLLLSTISNLSDASEEFCSRATSDGAILELFVAALDEPRLRGVDTSEGDTSCCGFGNSEQKMRALSQQHEALIMSYIGCLLNIAQRHPPSRALLQKLNALSALRFYLVAPVSDLIKVAALLTMSYLVTERNARLMLTDALSYEFLVIYIQESLATETHSYSGFNTAELLRGAANVCRCSREAGHMLVYVNLLSALERVLRAAADEMGPVGDESSGVRSVATDAEPEPDATFVDEAELEETLACLLALMPYRAGREAVRGSQKMLRALRVVARVGQPGAKLGAKRVLLELSPPSAVSSSTSQLSRVAPSPAVPGTAVRLSPPSVAGTGPGPDTGTPSSRVPTSRTTATAAGSGLEPGPGPSTRGARYQKTPTQLGGGGGKQMDSGISSTNSQSTPTRLTEVQSSDSS